MYENISTCGKRYPSTIDLHMIREVVVEICTDHWEDTIEAIRMGADRIELCSDLANDGLTPSTDLFARVLVIANRLGVTLFPMIRCRPGDFVYTDSEKATMIQDAKKFVNMGAHGIVIGALKPNGTIDLSFVKEIASVARSINPTIQITFHKAIDVANIPEGKSFSDIVDDLEPYCDRILTSGQSPTALGGAALIQEAVARNRRPYVLAAGKIRQENVQQVVNTLHVTEVHSRSPLIAAALGKLPRNI